MFRRDTVWRWFAVLMLVAGWAHATGQNRVVTYYYTDPQGTVLATSDESGNLLTNSDREPYGKQVLGVPQAEPGYVSHIDDPDTGLIYMQARYFDPALGRFLSIDPSAPIAGDLFGLGRYTYASNNPITHVDPDGRQSVPLEAYTRYWPGTEQEKQQSYINGMAGTLVSIATQSNVFDVAAPGSGSGAVASSGFPFEFTIAAGLTRGLTAATSLASLPAKAATSELETTSFFHNTTYSSKVIEQMSRGPGEFHSFPESVTAFETNGTITNMIGADGNAYQKLQIPGSYASRSSGYNGVFEFIKNEEGVINHRLFVSDKVTTAE